jgi:hypothetical protein
VSTAFVAVVVAWAGVDGLAWAEIAGGAWWGARSVVSERSEIAFGLGESANAATPIEGSFVVALSPDGVFMSPVALAG